MINFVKRVILSHFNFKGKVYCITFSPNGKYNFAPLFSFFLSLFSFFLSLFFISFFIFLVEHKNLVLKIFIPKKIPSFFALNSFLIPFSRYFAVGQYKTVDVWNTPSLEKEFAPFRLRRHFIGHYDAVTTVKWDKNSK